MAHSTSSPGPAAAAAFRSGMLAGGILGLVGLGLLYWTGAVTPIVVGYGLVALYPVYLVVVAVVLSRWLGYDKDATDLRPVSRERS